MVRTAATLIATFVVTVLTAACSSVPSAPVGRVPPEILNSPSQIVIGNATLRLDIYPYRDFQPGISVDTRLIAGFRLMISAGTFPVGLRAEKAWLVRDDEAWTSVPSHLPEISTPTQIEYVSRKGPEWPVGDLVVGVLLLRDLGNNSYFLRSAPQAVGRTD